MSARWRVRRTVRRDDDGQRRWDVAYHCLLQWIAPPPHDASALIEPEPRTKEEGDHGSRRVPAGLDQTPATDAQR